MSNKVEVTVGPGFLGLLTLLFIGLKLADVITWSWLWVLSPIWLPLAFVIVVILFVLIVGLIGGGINVRKRVR